VSLSTGCNREQHNTSLCLFVAYKFVALKVSPRVLRVIVGSGRNAVEAVADSDAKGFPDAILFKVPSLKYAQKLVALSSMQPKITVL
jgi:hypothetical protein